MPPPPFADEPSGAEPDCDAGTVLGKRYRLMRLLGEGGMGRVFLAEDLENGGQVAVKVLTDDRPIPKAAERFTREAQSIAKIDHPNVVAVSGIGESERGGLYYAMEYLEGEELADTVVREGHLPWSRAVHFALQICDALQAAHEQGVVHRDLKLENCFRVTRDGDPDFIKILDFGIAKLLRPLDEHERLTNTGATVGTPAYMAPELCRGKTIDHRVDVYALGVMLYEMLTGRLPFQGEAFLDVALQHMNDLPPPMATIVGMGVIPDALEAVVIRAMAKARGDRFPTMAAFARALRAVDDPLRRTNPLWGAVTGAQAVPAEIRPTPAEARPVAVEAKPAVTITEPALAEVPPAAVEAQAAAVEVQPAVVETSLSSDVWARGSTVASLSSDVWARGSTEVSTSQSIRSASGLSHDGMAGSDEGLPLPRARRAIGAGALLIVGVVGLLGLGSWWWAVPPPEPEPRSDRSAAAVAVDGARTDEAGPTPSRPTTMAASGGLETHGADGDDAQGSTGSTDAEPASITTKPRRTKLSKDQIDSALRGIRSRLRACTGTLMGLSRGERVRVELTIDRATGVVARSKVLSSLELPAATCVREALLHAKFSRTGPGGTETIRIRVTL